MANATWMESGTDATGDLSFYNSTSGTVSSATDQFIDLSTGSERTMNPVILLQIIQSGLAALPELITLYDQLKSGAPIAATDVQAILTKYGLDHTQLTADIAAEKATGN